MYCDRNTTWCGEMTIPAMVNDLPPFIQSIVNGLHHGSSTDQMNKLISMLREARMAKEKEEEKEMKREDEEVETESDNDKDIPTATNDQPVNGDPLVALEMKLKQFVTDQLTLLEQRLETKLNDLAKRVCNMESLNTNT